MVAFHKAVRRKAKLRLLLTGPSGSGKTYSALLIAIGMGCKRIAVIDTEHGSASLYSHLCDFDVLELAPPYNPERFTEAINAAGAAGYDCVIVDSTTHEWSGVGGCLELVDGIAASKTRGNTWAAWNDVTPRHRDFVDSMLRAPLHVIATGRSKTETAQTEGPNGKKQVVKLGMKTEQRDGLEYEFTIALDLSHSSHVAVASKDRTGLFGGDPFVICQATGAKLLAWLEAGADEPVQTAQPAQPANADPQQQEQAKKVASVEALAAVLNATVEEGRAADVAAKLASYAQAKLDVIWPLLSAESQAAVTAAWPKKEAA